MRKSAIILSLAAMAFAWQSCQKDSEQQNSNQNSASLSSSLTAAVASVATTEANQTSTEDIQSVALTKFDFGGGFMKGDFNRLMKFEVPKVSSCATVTVSSETYPKTITIDYGTGCTGHHGRLKSGKIVIELSDTITNAGATKTITYEDFYVDSMKVELSGTMQNLGQNADGNWILVSTYTQKSTTKDIDVVVENYTDTIVWKSGFDTEDKTDDIFSKTGSGTITINDSLAYSREITKALLTDNTCGYIVSGTVELYRKGTTVVIDYGDGTCDSKATVTTDGTSEEIDLNSRMFHEGGRFGKECGGKYHGGGFMHGGR